MATSSSALPASVSRSSRDFTPSSISRGPLNVRTAPWGVRRRRSTVPRARSEPLASSKRTLSSKWRPRTSRAPIRRRESRAASTEASLSLISVSLGSPIARSGGGLDHPYLHLDAVVRVVAAVAGGVHDLVRDLHAPHDAPEGAVLPVE